MNEFLLVSCSYIVGSIPIGYCMAKAKGIDLRQIGSGNIGATNVGRALGKPWAIAAFVGDALKGYLPTLAALHVNGASESHGLNIILGVSCAVAAIAGHNWPVFLKFKGGKGIATSAGALLCLTPLAVGVGVATWALVFFSSRYVSLASIIAALAIAISSWLLYLDQSVVLPSALTALAFLAIVRHRGNIQRLLSGTENRIERKRS